MLKTNATHILYNYEGSVRPGMITKKSGFDKKLRVKTMLKYTQTDAKGNPVINFKINPHAWRWPTIDQIHEINVTDIVDRIRPPHLVSSRSVEHFVDKINKYWTI